MFGIFKYTQTPYFQIFEFIFTTIKEFTMVIQTFVFQSSIFLKILMYLIQNLNE